MTGKNGKEKIGKNIFWIVSVVVGGVYDKNGRRDFVRCESSSL
jgi:hypothetical protein